MFYEFYLSLNFFLKIIFYFILAIVAIIIVTFIIIIIVIIVIGASIIIIEVIIIIKELNCPFNFSPLILNYFRLNFIINGYLSISFNLKQRYQ